MQFKDDALAWIDEFEKTLPSEDLESLVTIGEGGSGTHRSLMEDEEIDQSLLMLEKEWEN